MGRTTTMNRRTTAGNQEPDAPVNVLLPEDRPRPAESTKKAPSGTNPGGAVVR